MSRNGQFDGHLSSHADRDIPHFIVEEECAHCHQTIPDDGITGPDVEHYHRSCFGKLCAQPNRRKPEGRARCPARSSGAGPIRTTGLYEGPGIGAGAARVP
jgi:hypothetical protein